MTPALVTVVVPVKDDRRIETCLQSIRAAAPGGWEVEVVVVDNGSESAFSEWLEGVAAGARVIRVPEPGVYAARNAGVELATGEAVFFTDADCVARPGWFEAGLELMGRGYDLVQGFSGTTGADRVSRLLQARYEARFRRLALGEATEVDTRNLAVRRGVFERLRFNEAYRRVGDTEFGLRAELLGYRVGYAPGMRVDHAHDEDLRVFVAKQVCHGWGAQRLMRECPGVRWHGGHLRLVGRAAGVFERVPGRGLIALVLARGALAGAGGIQALGRRLPLPLAAVALTLLDKLAALAGHILYRPGAPEPSPSGILGRRLERD